MRASKFLHFILVMLLATLVAACGGGGSTLAEGGIGGTGISAGKITGFGSVIVNGVHFDTTNAGFSVDGDTATSESDLRIGMVVTINGTINADGTTGTAEKVTYDDVLQGPIQGTPTATSFVALKQTVIVDPSTLFDGGISSSTELMDQDVVEVSGYYDSMGQLHATFIKLEPSTEHEIRGEVTAVNAGNANFSIGALVVNYSNGPLPAVGDFVEAKGTYNFGSGELDAIEVEQEDEGLGISDADEAELEGLVLSTCTPVSLPCTFSLSGQTVQVDSVTELDGGLVSDIQPDVRLEVEGSLVGGILIASEIEFKSEVKLQSIVATKGVDTFTLDYNGMAIQVDIDPVLTRGYDEFDDTGFVIGANVEVEAASPIPACATTPCVILARHLELKTGDDEAELRGPLDMDPVSPNVRILGVDIDTTGLTFEDTDSASFFSQMKAGDIVTAEGKLVGSNITWEKIKPGK